MQTTRRPKYLNLIQIRLPIPGIVSIAHRISGVLMFLAIPFLAYVLFLATQNEAGFAEVKSIFSHVIIKLILFVLIWSVLHHLLAGIRYLLIDVDIGVEKQASRASAMIVMASGVCTAVIFGGILL